MHGEKGNRLLEGTTHVTSPATLIQEVGTWSSLTLRAEVPRRWMRLLRGVISLTPKASRPGGEPGKSHGVETLLPCFLPVSWWVKCKVAMTGPFSRPPIWPTGSKN